MRLGLAIMFSLMLAGTSFLSQAAGPCAKPTPRACCHGGVKMSCCDARQDAPTTPAVPTQPVSSNQILLLALTTVAWNQPEHLSLSAPSISPVLHTIPGTSLYARHCALLL